MEDFQNHGGSEGLAGRPRSQGAFDRKTSPEKECFPGAEQRMNGDRRCRRAEGYMWISTVGWICRRENRRRGEDPDPFGC